MGDKTPPCFTPFKKVKDCEEHPFHLAHELCRTANEQYD